MPEARSEVEERSLREIGRIATAFGILELMVNLILRAIVGVNREVAAILFTGDDIGRQLGRLNALVSDDGGPLKEWVSQVTLLKSQRNDLLHAGWFDADESGSSLTLRFKRGRTALIEERYTIAQLERIADRMEAAVEKSGPLLLAVEKVRSRKEAGG